jgi:dethiobiotin synthetase
VSNQPKAGVRIVVVGTGTEVGKTHVTTALVRAAVRAGLQAVGLKPVESGVGTGASDASRLGGGEFVSRETTPVCLP